jgi:hypothetical protein
MSNLSVFKFKSNDPVRVLPDNTDRPLFVASDVAKALGYKRPSDAYKQHCKGTVKHRTLQTAGGKQKLRVIHEPDVYRLIFGSKLKSAVQFQDWVFDEVLPAIRKTGKYEKPDPRARFLTEEQAGHIYHRVMRLAHLGTATYQGLFASLKRNFGVASYKDILKTDYAQACHFLGTQPKPELIKQTENAPIRELTDRTPMDGRYLVVIDGGKVNEMRNIEDKTVVPIEGYRKLNRNLSTIKRQLRWLEGDESADILDFPLDPVSHD